MKIAVIGGIGSGKSEVMKTVNKMGVATLSADEINTRLLATPEYVSKIAKRFPSAVKNGEIDRRALAEIIFSDDYERMALNAIAHPIIIDVIKQDKRNPLVVEVPIYFESGAAEIFDKTVAVVAPLDERIERLTAFRAMTKDDALARIKAQVDDYEYLKVADKVIENDSSLEVLEAKTEECFEDLFE